MVPSKEKNANALLILYEISQHYEKADLGHSDNAVSAVQSL